MSTTLTYEGPDARTVYAEIKRRCSIPTKIGASDYPYDPKTKVITSRDTESEHVEVYTIVTLTNDKLVAIVPYDAYRRLSCIDPISPTPIQSVNAVFAGVLRDYQVDGAAKVLHQLKTTGRCYLQAPPAYGKTVMMSWIISHLKEKTLIVVPCLTLAEQTQTSINQMLPGLRVHILETSRGERVIPEGTDILIAFVRRLCGTSAPMLQFKTVIFDEVHQLSTTIGIAAMLTVRPNHLLALTATPSERNPITELFVGKCEIKELSDRRWSICFPRIASGLSGDYSGVEGYTQAMGDLTKSLLFLTAIVRMIRYFVGIGKRIVVISLRREMSDQLATMLSDHTDLGKKDECLRTEVDEREITYAVLTPESRRCSNVDVIMGTHKLIGTGFDLSNYVDNFDGKCASVMIFLGSIKNQTLMYQAAGRGFRARDPLAVYPTIADLTVSVNHAKVLLHQARQSDGCVVLSDYGRFLETFANE